MSDCWPGNGLNNIPFYGHFYFAISLLMVFLLKFNGELNTQCTFIHKMFIFLGQHLQCHNRDIINSLIHSMFCIPDNSVPFLSQVSTTCTKRVLIAVFLSFYFHLFILWSWTWTWMLSAKIIGQERVVGYNN